MTPKTNARTIPKAQSEKLIIYFQKSQNLKAKFPKFLKKGTHLRQLRKKLLILAFSSRNWQIILITIILKSGAQTYLTSNGTCFYQKMESYLKPQRLSWWRRTECRTWSKKYFDKHLFTHLLLSHL